PAARARGAGNAPRRPGADHGTVPQAIRGVLGGHGRSQRIRKRNGQSRRAVAPSQPARRASSSASGTVKAAATETGPSKWTTGEHVSSRAPAQASHQPARLRTRSLIRAIPPPAPPLFPPPL